MAQIEIAIGIGTAAWGSDVHGDFDFEKDMFDGIKAYAGGMGR